MGRRLAVAVHIEDPVTRERLLLLPGDEPGEDLAQVVTNPLAWEPEEIEPGGDAGRGADEPEREKSPRARGPRKPATEK